MAISGRHNKWSQTQSNPQIKKNESKFSPNQTVPVMYSYNEQSVNHNPVIWQTISLIEKLYKFLPNIHKFQNDIFL